MKIQKNQHVHLKFNSSPNKCRKTTCQRETRIFPLPNLPELILQKTTCQHCFSYDHPPPINAIKTTCQYGTPKTHMVAGLWPPFLAEMQEEPSVSVSHTSSPNYCSKNNMSTRSHLVGARVWGQTLIRNVYIYPYFNMSSPLDIVNCVFGQDSLQNVRISVH